MSGARRDFTFFVVGGAGARLYDSVINDTSPSGAIAAVIAGVFMVALVWLATGWRITRRERPL